MKSPSHSIAAFAFLLCSLEYGSAIDFPHEIVPILRTHCADCHMEDSMKGGFSMNTREDLLAGSENGEVVLPGRGADSLLVELVATQDPTLRMPPKGEGLSPEEIAKVKKWIDADLPWEAGFAFGDRPYEPPLKHRQVTIPTVTTEVNTDIDRIVFPHLAAQGHTSIPVVEDAVFLRRV